jgi:ABC-2 type transport system permease protein
MVKKGFRVIFQLSKSFFLQEFRSRDSVFWILLFPVFMFILFGVLFGETEIRKGSITIGVDTALSEDSAAFDRFVMQSLEESETVTTVTVEREQGFKSLAENKLYAFITPGNEKDSYTVYVTEKNRPFQTVLSSLLEQSTLDSIKRIVKGRIPISYTIEVLEKNGHPLRYTYFLLAGIIGIAMMMNCFSAIPQTIISYRKQGFLKRLAFSPLRKSQFTISVIIQRIVFGITQLFLLILVAVLLFGVRLDVSFFAFLLTFFIGTATLAVIGFFLAGILRSVEAAIAVAQILTILFLFTCGIFVPLEMLPPYLDWITSINPAWHLSNAVYFTLILGYGVETITRSLLWLVSIGAGFFVLTILTFRYEKRV